MTELKIAKYSQALAVLYALVTDSDGVKTKDGYSQATQSGCKNWKIVVAAYIVTLLAIAASIILAEALVYIFW